MKRNKHRKKKLQYETDHRRYNFIRIWKKRYYHMTARQNGHSTNFSHSNGKEIMTQEEFIVWCKDFENLNVFLVIYFEWAEANFPLDLSPSIDRIDPKKGYIAENIQWLSFRDNCEKNHKFVDPISKKMIRDVKVEV